MTQRKLRINFLLYNPGVGGGDRVVAAHARYLKNRGHEVFVTALKPDDFSLSYKLVHYLRSGVFLKPGFSQALYDNAGVDMKVVTGKDKLENDDLPDADIVIATLWATAEWVIGLDPAKGKKVYFVQGHEVLPHFPRNRVQATYRAPLEKIVVSGWLEKVMREKYASPVAGRALNAVDHDLFNAPPRSKNARPRVGFVYADSWVKGVEFITDAIRDLQKRIPDLDVVAFGAAKVNPRKPLPPRCRYYKKPPQETIRELYSSCDVWLCASRHEGFGLPMVEAMACRCPVVTTAVGAAEDFIENGKQGYVVPVEDAGALAEKALQVLEASDEDWRRMSDAAHEAATRHSWDDAGAQFEETLYKILNQKEGPDA